VHTTKTTNVAVEAIVAVNKVTVNEMAADKRAIPTFKYIESGEPFSRVSSSDSETS
jgi:hypothetical protein